MNEPFYVKIMRQDERSGAWVLLAKMPIDTYYRCQFEIQKMGLKVEVAISESANKD